MDLVTDDNATKAIARTDGDSNTSDGLWHFVVGVRELDEIRIYRDGVLDATTGVPADYDLSGTSQWHSRIGAIAKADDPNLIYKGFDGLIDDVRVYDRALSTSEIEAMYEVGLAGGEYGGPGFVDATGGDYHLLSERGRYRTSTDDWLLDRATI